MISPALMHVSGLRGTTQYARIPLDQPSTDPFAGVFLDPFNQKGAELYLLEHAKGEVSAPVSAV